MSRFFALLSGCLVLGLFFIAGCENKGPGGPNRAVADAKVSDTTTTGTQDSATATTTTTAADSKPATDKTSDPSAATDSTEKPAQKQPQNVASRETAAQSKTERSSPAAATTARTEGDPLDWPNWRGPEQNRISRETGLIDHWNPDPKNPENVLWVNDDAGSISSPIVMRGKVYSIGRYKPVDVHEQEQVVCVDAETGKTLWRIEHNMFLAGVPAERIGWASVVGDPTTGASMPTAPIACCNASTAIRAR